MKQKRKKKLRGKERQGERRRKAQNFNHKENAPSAVSIHIFLIKGVFSYWQQPIQKKCQPKRTEPHFMSTGTLSSDKYAVR